MKNIKIILLFIFVIILSGCAQSGISINDEILDEKQAEEIKFKSDLIEFDDFELVKDSDWLIAIDEDEIPESTEDTYFIEEREFNELEEKLLEKMKQEKIIPLVS